MHCTLVSVFIINSKFNVARAALEELLGGSCYHGVVPVVEKVNCTQSQASNVQFFPEGASSLVESGHLQQQANRDRPLTTSWRLRGRGGLSLQPLLAAPA